LERRSGNVFAELIGHDGILWIQSEIPNVGSARREWEMISGEVCGNCA
jgi:hypothetical protein